MDKKTCSSIISYNQIILQFRSEERIHLAPEVSVRKAKDHPITLSDNKHWVKKKKKKDFSLLQNE